MPSPFRRLMVKTFLIAAQLVSLTLMSSTAVAQNGVIRVVVPQARLPVQITRVSSDTEVVGRIARTRVELEVRNPNALELEGELQFPLEPGQEVLGFALDIGGHLRPAVAVEKAKGRQVFDDVTRARVDPALLESTGGTNYKLRVYPLPASGSRRVVLDIASQLPRVQARGAESLQLRLPLQFGRAVQQMDVRVRIAGVAPSRVTAQRGAARYKPVADGRQGTVLALPRSSTNAGGHAQGLLVTIRHAAGEANPGAVPAVTTNVFKGKTYFYADAWLPTQTQARPTPRRVSLLWDASGSGGQRNHAASFALLDAWFRSVGRVTVAVQLLRDVPQELKSFEIVGGDWRELRSALEAVVYDGATRLGAARIPVDAQEVLLFSDGLDNYGAASLAPPAVPLHAIGSGAGSDARRLRQLAEASGGSYVDTSLLAADKAVEMMKTAHTRVVGLRSTGAADLLAASAYPEAGRLAVAGVLTAPEAMIEIDLESPNGQRSTRRIAVAAPATASASPSLASWQWAALAIEKLEADADRNSAAILRLGMHFSLATRATSLIVLDSVNDYARYEIEPPESLRADYERLMAQARDKTSATRAAHLKRVTQSFKAKADWWAKDFPKDMPPKPVNPQATSDTGAVPARVRSSVAAVAPSPAMRAPPAPAPAPAAAPSAGPSASAQQAGQAPATIRLQKWQPDEPYARRLRAASGDQMYAVYLDERPSHASSTAFHIDAADLFIERGQRELGLRILSNLAEMDLENRHILRILGYRLMQASAWDEAIPVLRKVHRLSPDEPQSWRDLALALDAAGQGQEAVNLLWHVASHPWNQRFPDIELIALAEMNAIIARHTAAGGKALDLSSIDPALTINMPLDLRAVLTWDADNTDIDLHVIDPNGEEVSFARTLSYQGGRISKDFVGGYGPEEFSLRNAKAGTYTVKARFYGHRQQIVAPATTLMLNLSTGFGTPGQKDQSTVLRLSGAGDLVTVGTFTVETAR
ncbi:VIT domain-containing protein [Ottowia thiooxydans]|uniref:VIT domain-containing protein n=1 Tax=Ottowia thiooxydans TaxID=219182 RepID=UPI0004249876|nr:VIT domain-containing protein [Ottowia thiooxydans]